MKSLKITAWLAGLGAVCGAAAGAALTYAGTVISGYPIPPDLGIYVWNSGVFAAIGAVGGPPMAWALLRDVPLWRALAEPAAVGLLASVASMLIAPAWFPLVVPLAIVGAGVRLRSSHAPPGEPRLATDDPQQMFTDRGASE